MSVPSPSNSNPAAHSIDLAPSSEVPTALPISISPLPYSREEYVSLPEPKKSLYLDYMLCNKIPAGPFDQSPEGIQRQTQIGRLIRDLQDNRQFIALNQLMERCGAVRRLPVSLLAFTPAALDEFLQAVQKHQPSLTSIAVFNNHRFAKESEATTKILAQFFSKNNQLTSFNLDYLLDKTISTLLKAIDTCSNPTQLDISPRREMSDETCEMLCTVIQKSKQLRAFHLFRPTISEQSKLAIILALSGSQHLEKLDIRYWNIDEAETLLRLTELLQRSTALKELTFDTDLVRHPMNVGNRSPSEIRGLHEHALSAIEICAIAEGIVQHPSLTSLTLGTLGYQYEIQNVLIEVLQELPCLTELDISSLTHKPLYVLEAIATLLEKNLNITHLTSDGDSSLAYPYALEYSVPELDQRLQAEYPKFQAIVRRIEDSLAKNRAIASSTWARIFSNALPVDQTSSVRPNSIADANQILASHILAHSSNLAEFEKTMIEIALSAEEWADKAVPPPVIEQTNDQGITLQNTHQQNDSSNSSG
jgi:hypothetical protein